MVGMDYSMGEEYTLCDILSVYSPNNSRSEHNSCQLVNQKGQELERTLRSQIIELVVLLKVSMK